MIGTIEKTLRIIAKSGLYGRYRTTTTELASEIGLSQQSTSRILLEMQNQDLIRKSSSKKGTELSLTEKAINLLKEDHERLSRIFNKGSTLSCKVVKGIGEGKFYIRTYEDRLQKVLGYKPFHGTLNLSAEPSRIKEFLYGKNKEVISPFKDSKRTYGEVDVYPVRLQGKDCAIIVPKRTSHPENIIEVVSKTNLKRSLGISISSRIRLSSKEKEQ